MEEWFEDEIKKSNVRIEDIRQSTSAIDFGPNIMDAVCTMVAGIGLQKIYEMLTDKHLLPTPNFGTVSKRGLTLSAYSDLIRKRSKYVKNTFYDKATSEERKAFDAINAAVVQRLKEMRKFQHGQQKKIVAASLKSSAVSAVEAGIVLAKVGVAAGTLGLVIGVSAAGASSLSPTYVRVDEDGNETPII